MALPTTQGRNTWEDASWATDREITRPLESSPFSSMTMSLSAVCVPWVSSRSVMTASAPLPQTILVYRLVESTPRICTVSIWMEAPSSRYTMVWGFMTFSPLPSPSA